jgi:hypothetical protein
MSCLQGQSTLAMYYLCRRLTEDGRTEEARKMLVHRERETCSDLL